MNPNKTPLRWKQAVLLLGVSLFPSILAAQETNSGKKPVGIDFFTQVKNISNLKEKDGNLFFILRQPDLASNAYVSDLYQLVDGKPVRLAKNVSEYDFLDNGIVFSDIREREDRERVESGEPLTVFQKLSTGYREAEEWLRVPAKVEQLAWISKGRFFFTSTYSRSFDRLLKESGGNRQEALKKQQESKNVRVFDELPFWSNGRGDISGLRTHLYFYDKGTVRLLTDTLASASAPELSPDHRTLVYTEKPLHYGKAQEGNRLVGLNVETLEKREWTLFDEATYGNVTFQNNEEVVLTISRSVEHDKMENAGFYRLNLRTEKLTPIYDGSLYGLGNSIGSDVGVSGKPVITFDKEGIRYVTTDVDHAPLVHVSFKDGKVDFLTEKSLNVQEYIPYKGGFLTIAQVGQYGSEICFIDKKGNLLPLTSINKPVFDSCSIVKPIPVTFTNEEGRLLFGYVLPPVNREPGKKYPAILDIHGGPKSAYGTNFFHEMQYWANQGYAVLFTNPTGSDGRGSAFSDIRGKVGGIDYRDLMTFVDTALVKTDFIDVERLGVTGGSYGGLMTNWIIGHTDRFRAAATQRSISSWLSFSNTSDIGHTYTYNYWGTDAWKNGSLLWENSPLKYADKVKTPTLILHSEEDYRCWLAEGIQLYYALQYFGVPSRMVVFKGENHELSRSGKPQDRIRRLAEITEWFDNYLKK